MDSNSKTPYLEAWDRHAPSWDQGMGDAGNEYFRFLEMPVLERMVNRRKGLRALDLATGNGLVARWLARGGASVVATDGSKPMVELARERCNSGNNEPSQSNSDIISFQVLDVTKTTSWDAFVSGNADVVCSPATTSFVPRHAAGKPTFNGITDGYRGY